MRHLWAHTSGRTLQNHSVIWWSDKCPRVWLLARVTAALDKGCWKKIWIYQNVHWRETILFFIHPSSDVHIRVPSRSQIQGWPGKTSELPWVRQKQILKAYTSDVDVMCLWCWHDVCMVVGGEQEERWMCCYCGLQRLYHSIYKARNSFQTKDNSIITQKIR